MALSTIKIEGLDKALSRLDVKRYEPQIQMCFDKFGIRVEMKAKQLAPVDEGHLRGAIFQHPGVLQITVGCAVEYAAYLEFGTRRFAAAYVAALPEQWQVLAESKRGATGGTFEEMVIRITAWVKRKGFAAELTKSGNKSKSVSSIAAQDQAAYMIARSIVRKGIKPHPYMYPAVTAETPQLLADLSKIKIQ